MSQKIEELTPEQEKLLPVYVEKYIELGLSTKPFPEDKTDLNAKINAVYTNGGVQPPEHIVYLASQKEILLALRLFLVAPKNNVCPVEGYLRNNLLTGTWLEDSQKFYDTLSDDDKKEVKTHLNNAINNMCYGSHDAGWVSFYDFCKTELKIAGLDAIEPLKAVCGVIGWYLPLPNICFVSQNPIEIHMKDDKLHNENGLAIKYADGFGVIAIDGVRQNSFLEMTLNSLKDGSETSEETA